jgi:hypothetical protein
MGLLRVPRHTADVCTRRRSAQDPAFARRQLVLPAGDNYFCRRRVSKGVSPTTWRHSVVVVGRLVAVENVSAGAPERRRRIGASRES